MQKIHPLAIVEDGAQLGADVEIGPYAHIGANVKIGDGTVVQQGTNMNAANFGNMEGGIMAAVVEATEALRMCGKLQDDISGVQPLVIQATLSNSQAYPFNNSKATIAIPTNDTRYDTGYIVIPEVVSYSGGGVKDIVISDKLVNGFKAEFTGGATSAVVKFYVVGGRND